MSVCVLFVRQRSFLLSLLVFYVVHHRVDLLISRAATPSVGVFLSLWCFGLDSRRSTALLQLCASARKTLEKKMEKKSDSEIDRLDYCMAVWSPPYVSRHIVEY